MIADAPVQEVSDGDERYHDSYHRAPSFPLSLNIDTQIAAQMFIGVFALEIGVAGVNMSIVVVIKVILNSIFGHNITSRVYLYWVLGCVVCRFI